MSERDGYEHGVPCMVAAVHADAPAAAAFYAELFGWETEDLMPAGFAAHYIVCTLRGRRVAAVVSPDGGPPPEKALWTTLVWVDDVEASVRAATGAGGTLIGEPWESPAEGDQAVIADPSGAVFCLWQPGANRGAQLVNEPGAWAMSMLHAPDPEAAAAFYAAVFGWETEAFGPATMWRLPGFFGGEPSQPVPRDVVAVMVSDGAEPHWSIDFWIADADAAAEKARELGGAVLVEPHDAPPFRRAVLASPDGASFSVSQLRPELLGG